MDIYKFKTLATNTSYKIPFEFSADSFNHWLASQHGSQATEQTHQVFLAVQAINKENEYSKRQNSSLLVSIYKSMPPFLAPLNASALNGLIPLATKEQDIVQHIASIYAELANGFARCITRTSDPASVEPLFYGLQSLIAAYMQISEAYQGVYPNFWKQSYLFYGWATKLEIQDLKIDQHHYHSNTISKAFKHLLALYHCDLAQYRPRDMRTISSCIEKHSASMRLGKKYLQEKTTRYSGFDLNSDHPPRHLSRLKKSENSALRFFSAYAAAIDIAKNAAQEAPGTGVIKAINREIILQAAKTLSLSKKRNFTRFSEQTEHSGMLGFKHIIEHLHHASPLTPGAKDTKHITQVDSRVAGGWAVPNIELVTEGYEILDAMKKDRTQMGLLREEQSKIALTAKNSLSKDIWSKAHKKPQNNTSISLEKFCIVDSSIKGYKIIFDTDTRSSKVQIGDIIGIDNNNTMEIGIICRLSQLEQHKLQLGIKLLAPESEIAYISLPEHDSIYAWAIFLPGIKVLNSADSLIFNDSKFQCGEFVKLHRVAQAPVSCRLNKLLQLNFAVVHIELSNSMTM